MERKYRLLLYLVREIHGATASQIYQSTRMVKKLVYTVTEDTVANYSTAIEGSTITNSYKPGKTSVTVTKKWVDAETRWPSSEEHQGSTLC